MPNKITNKQRQQQKQIINRRKKQKQIQQKRIQQRKKKQKQIQQKRIQQQRQQQMQQRKKRQQQLQKQRKIYQQRRQKKLKQLRQHQKKQRQLRLNRGCYRECQCNFHREDDYEYYGNCNHHNHHNNHHNNNNQCSCSDCGVNLPPSEVCVPSRNYQFFQLPNAPIYDIPDFGYGGGFGSGLGHDMRMPYISPHAGMDMFTGTLDAPIAPNPMYLSYPLF